MCVCVSRGHLKGGHLKGGHLQIGSRGEFSLEQSMLLEGSNPVLPFLDFSVLPRKNPQINQGFLSPAEPTKTLEKQEKKNNFNQGNSLLKINQGILKTKERKDREWHTRKGHGEKDPENTLKLPENTLKIAEVR